MRTPGPGQGQLLTFSDAPDDAGRPLPAQPRFNGSDYVRAIDDPRLTGQIRRVFDLMADGRWRTLTEIQAATRDPAASISAQLRHLRKDRFGAHQVAKRHRGDAGLGLYEYQLIVNAQPGPVAR